MESEGGEGGRVGLMRGDPFFRKEDGGLISYTIAPSAGRPLLEEALLAAAAAAMRKRNMRSDTPGHLCSERVDSG